MAFFKKCSFCNRRFVETHKIVMLNETNGHICKACALAMIFEAKNNVKDICIPQKWDKEPTQEFCDVCKNRAECSNATINTFIKYGINIVKTEETKTKKRV